MGKWTSTRSSHLVLAEKLVSALSLSVAPWVELRLARHWLAPFGADSMRPTAVGRDAKALEIQGSAGISPFPRAAGRAVA